MQYYGSFSLTWFFILWEMWACITSRRFFLASMLLLYRTAPTGHRFRISSVSLGRSHIQLRDVALAAREALPFLCPHLLTAGSSGGKYLMQAGDASGRHAVRASRALSCDSLQG